jgi:hypothetical protein
LTCSAILSALIDGPLLTCSPILSALIDGPLLTCSAILSALIDGPLLTCSPILSALTHPTWNALDVDRLRRSPTGLVRWLAHALKAQDAASSAAARAEFARAYALALGFALLSVVLFVGRAHERCVYALRDAGASFRTDFARMGTTRVVHKTLGGRLLYLTASSSTL